ncbi:MAG: IS5 family transposase, partial [Magnetococcus sp. YQC-9]
MDRLLLRDDQWERIKGVLPKMRGNQEKIGKNQRTFIEAILWTVRTGAPWRDIPISFGGWSKNYKRLSRWVDNETWERIMKAVSDDPDLEALLIDSTIIRAHQHAAGAQKKRTSSHRTV